MENPPAASKPARRTPRKPSAAKGTGGNAGTGGAAGKSTAKGKRNATGKTT